MAGVGGVAGTLPFGGHGLSLLCQGPTTLHHLMAFGPWNVLCTCDDGYRNVCLLATFATLLPSTRNPKVGQNVFLFFPFLGFLILIRSFELRMGAFPKVSGLLGPTSMSFMHGDLQRQGDAAFMFHCCFLPSADSALRAGAFRWYSLRVPSLR